ncbi:MAG: hypothetical protein R3C44_22530 [Chloroflexota bacterium]
MPCCEVDRMADELESLIRRINRTNSATVLEPGDETIADAIAQQDVLRVRRTVYKAAAEAGIVRRDRYSKSELRFECSGCGRSAKAGRRCRPAVP